MTTIGYDLLGRRIAIDNPDTGDTTGGRDFGAVHLFQMCLYLTQNPERWSCNTRNWSLPDEVWLNRQVAEPKPSFSEAA